jgi:hypothetical protein
VKRHPKFVIPTEAKRSGGTCGFTFWHSETVPARITPGFRFSTNANHRSLHYAPPDFLSRLVALSSFMRLSLRKAPHAAMFSAAWQEIRYASVGMTSLGWRLPLAWVEVDGQRRKALNRLPAELIWTSVTLSRPFGTNLRIGISAGHRLPIRIVLVSGKGSSVVGLEGRNY